MYKVLVIDANASQENPIKPLEFVVSEEKLSECISKYVLDSVFCHVSKVDIY